MDTGLLPVAWCYTDDGLGNLDVDVIGATDLLTGDVTLMVMLIVAVVIVIISCGCGIGGIVAYRRPQFLGRPVWYLRLQRRRRHSELNYSTVRPDSEAVKKSGHGLPLMGE